jgi:hypothetical protein
MKNYLKRYSQISLLRNSTKMALENKLSEDPEEQLKKRLRKMKGETKKEDIPYLMEIIRQRDMYSEPILNRVEFKLYHAESESISKLVECIHDNSTWVRSAVCYSLLGIIKRNIKDERYSDELKRVSYFLLERVADDDKHVRTAAFYSIGSLGYIIRKDKKLLDFFGDYLNKITSDEKTPPEIKEKAAITKVRLGLLSSEEFRMGRY